ncbi:MAG: hypothetical protein AAFR28_17390, partial [Pseudomonadota bacterium]
MSIAAPLQWPEGWPRHKGPRDHGHRFAPRGQRELTLAAATDGLFDELDKLGATAITVSMNIESTRPLSRQKRAEDPGVSVFFTRGGKPMTMAQDRFDTVAANARSLALAVGAMRAIDRHGGGVIAERAFEGFVGVPALKTGAKAAVEQWWEVLGVSRSSPLAAVRGAWQAQSSDAQKRGDMSEAQRLNAALAAAQE